MDFVLTITIFGIFTTVIFVVVVTNIIITSIYI